MTIAAGNQALASDVLRIMHIMYGKEGAALAISSGAVAVSGDEAYFKVSGEGAAADDLVTINGGSDGDIVILAYDGEALSVKETGNIVTGDFGEFQLSSSGHLAMFRYDGANWELIATNVVKGGLSTNVETLSGSKTLTDNDDIVQLLDPDGTDRDVIFPAESSNNHPFYIFNAGETNDLVLQDDGGGSEVRVSPNQMASVYPNLSDGWRYRRSSGWAVIPSSVYAYAVAGNVQDNDQYSPDSWISKTNVPSPTRSKQSGAVIDNKGYIASGYASGYLQDTDEYDPDSWTSKTNTPSPARNSSVFGDIGGTAGYLVGGYDGSNRLQDNDKYDPDSWTSVISKNSPGVSSPAYLGLDSKFYLVGGLPSTGGYGSQDTDEYTPDSWTSKTNHPSPTRQQMGYFSINDTKGYIVGGLEASRLQDTDEYDPDTWVSKINCPSPARSKSGGADIATKGHVFGGSDGSSLQDNDEYYPDTWTSKTSLPSPARSSPSGYSF